MCEHGCRASHNEGHDDQNIRPRQLRNREVPWEGSQRSKLMSRRTERPYKVDGADKLARHSAVRCSVPEINGPAVQREFTFLLRETCGPAPPETAGTVVSNGRRRTAGVSRGRSTESNEPGKPEGLTTREGLNLAGRTRPSVVLFPVRRRRLAEHWAAIIVAEKEWLLYPSGLPGTAGRGPACPVVWEAGREIPTSTRLGDFGQVVLDFYIHGILQNPFKRRRRGGIGRRNRDAGIGTGTNIAGGTSCHAWQQGGTSNANEIFGRIVAL